MLKLTNISHSFDGVPVLKDQSLTVASGERIALMGPSGVGKTTLLRIATGLIRPDSGQVENTFQRTVTVFQEPRLLPWRTAAENVNLVLGDNRSTMAQALEWLEQLGLSDAVRKYPHELSGGMQQRVALARALCCQGDLLVLDEPFKAMDDALQQQIIDMVRKTDAAILLVTHEVREAEALGCCIVTL